MNDIIKQAKQGDEAACTQLVEEYWNSLAVYAAYYLPNQNSVDDVVQMTFIKVFEQIDKFREDGDFGVWLRSICHFQVLSERKKWQRESANKEKFKLERLILEASLEERLLEPEQNISLKLDHCCDKLKPISKELLELKYEKGYNSSEIASHFKKTITWVTSTLSRVRSTLKQCIT